MVANHPDLPTNSVTATKSSTSWNTTNTTTNSELSSTSFENLQDDTHSSIASTSTATTTRSPTTTSSSTTSEEADADLQIVLQHQSYHSKIGTLLAVMPIVFGIAFCWERGLYPFLISTFIEHCVHYTTNYFINGVKSIRSFSTVNTIRVCMVAAFHMSLQVHYGPFVALHVFTVYKIVITTMMWYFDMRFILLNGSIHVISAVLGKYIALVNEMHTLSDLEIMFAYRSVFEVFVLLTTVLISSLLFSQHMNQTNEQYTKQQIEITKERVRSTEKTKFIANLSHEARNPLHGILGSLQLLRHNVLGKDEKCEHGCEHCLLQNNSTSELVQDIEENSKTLLHILSSSLHMSNLELGKINLKLEPFNIMCLVESITSVFSQLALEKQLTLHSFFDVQNVPIYLKGDSTRISQIVMNLVSNSIKYTSKGFVKLTCELASEKDLNKYNDSHPKVSKKGDIVYIKIECQDTGRGIPESQLQNIFQPYNMIEETTLSKKPEEFERYFKQSEHITGGSSLLIHTNRNGLGLSISKFIIEKMNGTITVSSKENEGTTFTVILPLQKFVGEISEKAAVNPDNIQEILHYEADSSQKIKVLIFDLDPCFRQVLQKYAQLFKRVDSIEQYADFEEFDRKRYLATQDDEKQQRSGDSCCNTLIVCMEQYYEQLSNFFQTKQNGQVVVVPAVPRGRNRMFEKIKYLSKPIKFADLFDIISDPRFSKSSLLQTAPSSIIKTPRKSIVELDSQTAASLASHMNMEFDDEVLSKPVLVVDDNGVNRKILSKMLRIMGFTDIDLACDGMECFNMFKKKNYCLILLDCVMPILSGKEACEMIRKYEKQNELEHGANFTRLPIVAVTANTWETKEVLLAQGFDSVMYKPIAMEQLKVEMLKVLSHAENSSLQQE
ncbi:hypothetical protein C9374_003250 [Naegleria lovaniensis]|uniref:Histidine kinase n=1 Tax=Naegleria lovaniensis TaxID=51637 RepID=A0AA88KJA9_NAELO|nr:uncharacterized protein C9374_003250 [Naegleria lovaniensis]KAG2385435.1 hypothetical protein C9374_003250 [Naegleria lovaniensis]